jgi:hypothetical protein
VTSTMTCTLRACFRCSVALHNCRKICVAV